MTSLASIGLFAPSSALANVEQALIHLGLAPRFAIDPTSGSHQEVPAVRLVVAILSPSMEDALEAYDQLLYNEASETLFDELQGREGWGVEQWVAKLAPKAAFLREASQEASPKPAENANELGGHAAVPAPLVEGSQSAMRPASMADGAGILDLGNLGAGDGMGLEWAPTAEAGAGGVPPSASDSTGTPEAQAGGFSFEDFQLVDPDPVGSWEPTTAADVAPEADEPTTLSVSESGPGLEIEQAREAGPCNDDASSIALDDEAAAGLGETGAELALELEPLVEYSMAPPGLDPATASQETPRGGVGPTAVDIDPDQWPGQEMGLESAPDRGFVLIVGGLGGPAAIREIISHLNAHMPIPVIVYQPMPQGRYEVLAANLGKNAPLPVAKAEEGQALASGHVWVMGEGMVPEPTPNHQFKAAEGELGQAILLAGQTRSAVVVVSGASEHMVFPAMEAMALGAQLFGQEPDRAYEAGTIRALLDLGLMVGTPAELGAYLAEHWGVVDLPGAALGA